MTEEQRKKIGVGVHKAKWRRNISKGMRAAKAERMKAMGGGMAVKSPAAKPAKSDYFIVRMAHGGMEVIMPITFCPEMVKKLEDK